MQEDYSRQIDKILSETGRVYWRGQEAEALSAEAIRGLKLDQIVSSFAVRFS